MGLIRNKLCLINVCFLDKITSCIDKEQTEDRLLQDCRGIYQFCRKCSYWKGEEFGFDRTTLSPTESERIFSGRVINSRDSKINLSWEYYIQF